MAKDEATELEVKGKVVKLPKKVMLLAQTLLARIKVFVPTTREDYETLCHFELQCKAEIKDLTARFMKIAEKQYVAWKETKKQQNEAIDPYDEALAIAQEKRLAFEESYEEQRKQKQIDAQQAAIEASKIQNAALADMLDAQNEPELAAQMRESFQAPAITIESDLPVVAGVETRTKWLYKIADESLVDRTFFAIDHKKIEDQVDSLGKDAEKVVGGIVVYAQKVPWGAAKKWKK